MTCKRYYQQRFEIVSENKGIKETLGKLFPNREKRVMVKYTLEELG